jgi:hypothetical protein
MGRGVERFENFLKEYPGPLRTKQIPKLIIDLDRDWKEHQIVIDTNFIYLTPINDLKKYRKGRRRRRGRSLSGYAEMKLWAEQKQEDWLDGISKWDALHASIKAKGWSIQFPAIVRISEKGLPKLQNGNHRISIAEELNIIFIPTFYYYVGKFTT